MISVLEQLRPHHEELRKRLLVSIAVVAACSGVAWLFIDQLTALCISPLLRAAPEMGKLVYTKLTDAFISYLKLTLIVGITASFPFLLYQAWMFAAPGLLADEKRIAQRIIFWSTGLFVAGALFSFFIVLPQTLAFFMSYTGENLQPMLKISLYLTFVARMVLAFAAAFEIPFLMVMAAAAGLVRRDHFTSKRKFFYIAIVVLSFLLAAGDLTATVLLALPLFGLYEAGIVAVRIFSHKKEEAAL
ncbi:MAG: Sec-independent protein translocase TatC [Candidatus Electronema aureum]|uniref:Sec-independent protein translocase protein TatC n=1 Tax=Candidatus Electronema aureum TaxID=2005002 RepID=A0A521G184_9BACT|nr:MAG: Sec-independent protein translocase TatC [Candidatus Electronema aureum]